MHIAIPYVILIDATAIPSSPSQKMSDSSRIIFILVFWWVFWHAYIFRVESEDFLLFFVWFFYHFLIVFNV